MGNCCVGKNTDSAGKNTDKYTKKRQTDNNKIDDPCSESQN